MTVTELNNITTLELFIEFQKCCGSTTWVGGMCNQAPFESEQELIERSKTIWTNCNEQDCQEAFTHHPKIGDFKNLEKKFASTKEWTSGEQASVDIASTETIQELVDGNNEYEEKFSFIFIICATGKSASEMLDLLKQRLPNDPSKEIEIAKAEQGKITEIRLRKLLAGN